MLFNSYTFLIFISIFFISYYWIPSNKRKYFLLIGSYLFYAHWDVRFISLILLSTFIDYFSAIKLEKSIRLKKLWLSFSIVSNLTILIIFKYFNFFSESLVKFINTLGFNISDVYIDLFLPVGVSFYTFQSMSYTIDVYRKKVMAEKDFTLFALFIAFFPQLIAGPIERANRLIPQLRNLKMPSQQQVSESICLLLWGFFLKLVIADNISMIADESFDFRYTNQMRLGTSAILGTVAFSIQIYCDFRGYSNIARGLAKLLGINLMRNFWHPYFSSSPSIFWKRWHISLSEWFRDYVYIPIGGNRSSSFINLRNLFFTMFLAGLWHGASGIFIIWGLYHAILLVIYRWSNKKFLFLNKNYMKGPLIFIFFLATLYGWLIFRSNDISQIITLTKNIFLWKNNSLSLFSERQFIQFLWVFIFGAIVIAIDWWQEYKNDEYFLKFPSFSSFFISIIILLVIYFFAADTNSFIYFQF